MNTYLKLLILFSCSSPLTHYVSRIFVSAVQTFGKTSGYKKSVGFMLVGLVTAAICLVPFFSGFILAMEDYRSSKAPLIALLLIYPISMVPFILHVRRNIEVFYSTGYWKRLK